MTIPSRWVYIALLIQLSAAIYAPVREYSGPNFFSGWDYYGFVDNTTWGNVTYVDQNTGSSQKLTYVDPSSGHAIIRVDNTTNIPSAPLVNRNSVKITTQDAYPIGSLITIDVSHIPYGCSVWPSFWMLGTNLTWPFAGEIDIIEGINSLSQNQMALHTTPGCNLVANSTQTGHTVETDCSTGQGCLVQETKPNSFGVAFAQNGGGVFAAQLDVSGIYMWFWPRSSLPQSISHATSQSTMDLSDWGTPTAAYPSTGCNIAQYFQPQQLVLDITLCGVWAGVPSIYSSTGCSGQCINNVIGSGNPVYNEAYWDISYIRTYIATADANTPSPSAAVVYTTTTVDGASSTSDSPSSSTTTGSGNGNNAEHATNGGASAPRVTFGSGISITRALLIGASVAALWML
ncbi:glycoside hydrolase family 16 protein [Collybiopsis luxurians FD-317 M1]|uniref:Glycoside hydrolase family 16 protein n=1 Tax=Collybiopsis luxurians FD-317 M1 TaxID=944289 RepID=A0A0D0BVP5_9AGAR|nr:glycoside hydrolase family 16 protein [Collybiopsis luxurians FD-317 M1]